MMHRHPTFDVAQFQKTMRHLYVGNLSRTKQAKDRNAGRVIATTVEPVVCYNCDKTGYF